VIYVTGEVVVKDLGENGAKLNISNSYMNILVQEWYCPLLESNAVVKAGLFS
jgi:hypothetical protein